MSKAKTKAAGFRESEPDITDTGVGKNYKGYRIFHTRKKGTVEKIAYDYSISAPSATELGQFRRDLARAAAKDRRIGRYLDDFPSLRERALPAASKPEPEPPMAATDEGSGTAPTEVDGASRAADEK